MKNIVIIYIALIVVVIILAVFRGSIFSAFAGKKNPQATINNKTFDLIEAKTDDERVTGLSGRTSLDQNTGMLFVFTTKDKYPFWMKDMKFSIDIIYINDNKIVDEFPDVPVPNDPSNLNSLTLYKPKEAANYVLEVNAGTAKKDNIKIGDSVSFSNL